MLSEALSFIAEEMEKIGINLIPVSHFHAQAAIQNSCDKLEASSTVASAAFLVVLLPRIEVLTIRNRFGDEVADLVARFNGGSGDKLTLWGRAIACIAEKDAAIYAAAITILSGEARLITNSRDSVVLRSMVQEAVDRGAESSLLLETIEQLGKTEPVIESKAAADIWLISISIDIASSTEAKSRMVAVSGSGEALAGLYKNFYSQFLNSEDRLYGRLFKQGRTFKGDPIDWRRLFVVKGIGDEIWLLYEIPADLSHLRNSTARLLDATIGWATELIRWSGGSRKPESGGDFREEINGRHDHMSLPIKVYMDLVRDGFETSKMRGEKIGANAGQYLHTPNAPFGIDHIKIANRLNAGHLELAGRQVRHAFRTDYIGHEIDRFFRTSKVALPGVVTIGESLFERLDVEKKLTVFPGLFEFNFKYTSNGSPGTFAFGDLICAQTDLSASEIKGVGYSYRAYHVSRSCTLRSLHRSDVEPHILEGIKAKFSEEALEDLLPLNQRLSKDDGSDRSP